MLSDHNTDDRPKNTFVCDHSCKVRNSASTGNEDEVNLPQAGINPIAGAVLAAVEMRLSEDALGGAMLGAVVGAIVGIAVKSFTLGGGVALVLALLLAGVFEVFSANRPSR